MIAFKDTDGKIHIKYGICFESLAKVIVWIDQLRTCGDKDGNMYCPYCGKKLNEKNKSLDHIHPQDGGGTSVPENLEFICRDCNSEKSNLSKEVFLKIRNLPDEKKRLIKAAEREKNKALRRSKFPYYALDPDEVQFVDSSLLISPTKVTIIGKGYYRKEKFLEEYHFLQNPILVAHNTDNERLVVLNGAVTLKLARKLKINPVPVIILENFIVDMDDSHFGIT